MEDIQKVIIDYLGHEPPRMCGAYMAVKIYVRDKISETSLITLSEQARRTDEYSQIVGRVVAMGAECFLDEKRFPTGPRCKVGDWIAFKPNCGTRLKRRGHVMEYMYDEAVLEVLDDPSYVTRC